MLVTLGLSRIRWDNWKTINLIKWGNIRDVAIEGTRRIRAPPLQFPKQRRSKNFSFKQGYCFLWMLRYYTDQKFRNFYRACYNRIFGQFMAAFHFSNYIREKDHFTLDLLKRSDTYRYTNADLKICQDFRLHLKIIC